MSSAITLRSTLKGKTNEVLKDLKRDFDLPMSFYLHKDSRDIDQEVCNALDEALLALEKQEKLKVWLEKEIERIFANAKRTVKPEHEECICDYCCGWNQFEGFIEKELKLMKELK